jgi:HK97 family phage prohead protease
MSTPLETSGPLRAADAVAYLPRKTFDCEFKALDDAGSFEVYAAVFSNVDRQRDVIEPNAFKNLDEFVEGGWIAVGHDSKSLPVAYPTAAVQDSIGLRVSGRFHATPEAQSARTVIRERMAAGKKVKASIGYVSNDESFERIGGKTVRRIKDLSIYEASFVIANLPANPLAEVVSAKSLEDAVVDVKAGRVVSRATYNKLRSLLKDLDEFIESHNPDGTADEPAKQADEPASKDDDVSALRDHLQRRALMGRRVKPCP